MTINLIVTNHNCNVLVFIFFNRGLCIPVMSKYMLKQLCPPRDHKAMQVGLMTVTMIMMMMPAARPQGHASRTRERGCHHCESFTFCVMTSWTLNESHIRTIA